MAERSLKQVTRLYHFTDRRNLPLIQKHGGLFSWEQLTKKKIRVPFPGGNQWSRDADELKAMDRFVHLCFRPTHPMEYQARDAGHIGETVFLEIHADIMQVKGVEFTPGVANKSGVLAYDLKEAIKLIDYEVLYTRTDWSDRSIQERLQNAEKCEILIPDHVPLNLIRNFPNG